MEVEVIVDAKYNKPKAIIYTNAVSDEVAKVVNELQNSGTQTLNGYLDNKICILNLEKIFDIYAEGGKVYAKSSDETYSLKYRLYELEKLLSKDFIRISNSEIINLKKVKNLDFSLLGTIKINFINGTFTYCSRRFIKKIKEHLGLWEYHFVVLGSEATATHMPSLCSEGGNLMKILKELAISLIGIPIAGFVFITVYVLTYLLAGEETYIILIESLKDFSVLAEELVVIAISMYISVLSYRLCYRKVIGETKVSGKVLYMCLFIIGFALVPLLLAYYLINSFRLFGLAYLIVWVMFVAIISLGYMIKDFVDVWFINRKLRTTQK